MSEILLKALGPRPGHPVDGVFIASQLGQAIASGTLPVGTKLSQQAIADHFDVSRMPVREALRCLQVKGLTSQVPNQTAVVASIAADESDLAQARARVEGLQAQLNRAVQLLQKCHSRLNRPLDALDLAPKVAAFLAAHRGHQVGES